MGHLILVNKEYGKTSNDVVQIIKKLTQSKKAGHAGTLDPLATGLLLIATDEKTKELNNIIDYDKQYEVEIKFGEHRTTYDSEGDVLKTSTVFPLEKELILALNHLQNIEYNQQVPIYSSVKINGKKLYEYARQNIEVECPKKLVKIKKLELLEYDLENRLIKLRMDVSKGFYVRSFAVDLAAYLNCYAYVYNLKRTKIGNYDLKNAINDYRELWRYHAKVKMIDVNSIIDKKTNNLIIGQFDVIHYDQSSMFNLKDFSVLTFINNPSKNYYLNDMLVRIWNLNDFDPKSIFIYDIKNNLDANNFNEKILKKINPKKIIVGKNFKYGWDGKNYENLMKDFDVKVISTEEKTSSTKIRSLLSKGLIKEANEIYLSFFKVKGKVIDGNKKGRLINYPTINVEWQTNVKMESGSYISLAKIGRKIYPSTTFIWDLKSKGILTETFIHDFNSDVYGKIVEVWPIEFIAKFSKVESMEQLVKKIEKEVLISKKFHKNNLIQSENDYLIFLNKNNDVE